MADPVATLTKKLADYLMTSSVPWPDEGAMRRAVFEVVRLMVTEAAPEALSLIHEMKPDPIERDPDPIQSSHWQADLVRLTASVDGLAEAVDHHAQLLQYGPCWQADIPEEDGWYVVRTVDDDAPEFAQITTEASGRRYVDVAHMESWRVGIDEPIRRWRWLVTALDLPPIPVEEP